MCKLGPMAFVRSTKRVCRDSNLGLIGDRDPRQIGHGRVPQTCRKASVMRVVLDSVGESLAVCSGGSFARNRKGVRGASLEWTPISDGSIAIKQLVVRGLKNRANTVFLGLPNFNVDNRSSV